MSRQSTRAAVMVVSAAVTALMIGLHAVRGDPAPAQAVALANPAAHAFKSPSLWRIVKTDDRHPAVETSRACLSPSGFPTVFKGIKPDSGCAQSVSTRIDGSKVVEIHCKSVPGAKWSEDTSVRIEASSDLKTIHQHSEVQFPNLDAPFNKTHVSDAVTTYLGDCPVPMRPDQFMLLQGDDGKFADPLSGLAELLKKGAPAPDSRAGPKP